jgi:hypothetical protein
MLCRACATIGTSTASTANKFRKSFISKSSMVF